MEAQNVSWELLGEALIARVRIPPHRSPALPKGIKRLRGIPAVVIAEHFSSSPLGEFLSFAIGIPARMGLRPGFAFPVSAVNSEEIRIAARNNWGFPSELGDLRWNTAGREREIVWEDRGIAMRGIPATIPFPFAFRFRSLLRREDRSSITPILTRGLARRAHVDITVESDDSFVWLDGEHRGIYLSSQLLRLRSARRPLGWVSSLRAPLPMPGPRLRPGEVQRGAS